MPVPSSPLVKAPRVSPDMSSLIGKRIQVHWDMSDGTLQWFDATVQSCSSDDSEAILIYDEGESYLLDVYGETEWRPMAHDIDAPPAPAATEQIRSSTAPGCSTAPDSKIIPKTKRNNDNTKSIPAKSKPDLSLRSLIKKVTSGASLKEISAVKKNMTTDVEARSARFGSQPRPMKKQKLQELPSLLVSSTHEERDLALLQKQAIENATEITTSHGNCSHATKRPIPRPVMIAPRPLTFCDRGIGNEEPMVIGKPMNSRTTAISRNTEDPIMSVLRNRKVKEYLASKQTTTAEKTRHKVNSIHFHPDDFSFSNPFIGTQKPIAIGKTRVTSLPRHTYDPIMDAALSNTVKEYLASLHITTARDLLLTRTQYIAMHLPKWRTEKGMRELKGTGAASSVSLWKQKVRELGAVVGESSSTILLA